MYEVNIRQYSEAGTFEAFQSHIPRLKELGIDILWLMPIYPIGEKNRKGELGSYYSVQDYTAVNPEFGNMDDLKELVSSAHASGMYVILDWVANHTARDHTWVTEHPEWYKTDSVGNLVSPYDWTDVAQLDFSNNELRLAMKQALVYWVKEADIDGYRCDVAGMIPCDFWEDARASLDSIKPVFMLAEDEGQPCLVKNAFDMNYAWELHHIMNEVAKGEMPVQALRDYYLRQDSIYNPDIYRLNFITNHDENSWNGTVFERLGNAAEVYAALTFTLPGMPLIYSGQEIGLNKRLKFFESDPIEWKNSPWSLTYQKLIKIKKENKALWNGTAGGEMELLTFGEVLDSALIAYRRVKNENEILVFANLSAMPLMVDGDALGLEGTYVDAFTWQKADHKTQLNIKAYSYRIWVKEIRN
jgi:glycosidase